MTDSAYRQYGRHVVKFADGTYLSPALTYESRVPRQYGAQRFATWASAKAIAEGTPFDGNGARAVRLSPVVWLGIAADGETTLLGRGAKMRELWRKDSHPGWRRVRFSPRWSRT